MSAFGCVSNLVRLSACRKLGDSTVPIHTIGSVIESELGGGFSVRIDCKPANTSVDMRVDFGPLVDDNGKVDIGVFGSGKYRVFAGMSSGPIMVIKGIAPLSDTDASSLGYEIMPDFESWCIYHGILDYISLRDLAKAVFSHATCWVTNASKHEEADYWISFMAALPLPDGAALNKCTVSVEDMVAGNVNGIGLYEGLSVTRVRQLVLANNIPAKGIKKADLIRAIIEDAMSNPERKRESYFCSGLRCDHPDYRTSSISISLTGEIVHEQWEKEPGSFITIDRGLLALPLRDQKIYGPPVECLIDPLSDRSSDPETALHKVAAALETISPSQSAAIENAVVLQKCRMNRLKIKAEAAEKRSISMNAELSEFQEQCESVLSACRKDNTVSKLSGVGCVSIMGQEFPTFNFPGSALKNWSPESFVAQERVGRVGQNIVFNIADVTDAILHNAVTSLVGPPGTGKTTVVQWIANALSCPSLVVQFTRDKQVEDLFGCDKIANGSQVWCDGEITAFLRMAAQNPDTPCIMTFDEFDHADAAVQSTCQPIVEYRPLILPNGESINVGENVHFVLTRNTSGHGDATGRHAAANISDSAFNSRIGASFSVTYMKPERESAILAIHGLELSESVELVNFAQATRVSVESGDSGDNYDSMSEPVCLRHLISYAKTRARGVSRTKALASCIMGALPPADRTVANELAIVHIKDWGVE
jgi:hypothetical protein